MQLNCSRQSAVQIGLNPTQVFTKCSRRHNNHYRYQSVESENNQNQWQGRDLHRDLSKEPSRHPDSFSKVKEAATPYYWFWKLFMAILYSMSRNSHCLQQHQGT